MNTLTVLPYSEVESTQWVPLADLAKLVPEGAGTFALADVIKNPGDMELHKVITQGIMAFAGEKSAFLDLSYIMVNPKHLSEVYMARHLLGRFPAETISYHKHWFIDPMSLTAVRQETVSTTKDQMTHFLLRARVVTAGGAPVEGIQYRKLRICEAPFVSGALMAGEINTQFMCPVPAHPPGLLDENTLALTSRLLWSAKGELSDTVARFYLHLDSFGLRAPPAYLSPNEQRTKKGTGVVARLGQLITAIKGSEPKDLSTSSKEAIEYLTKLYTSKSSVNPFVSNKAINFMVTLANDSTFRFQGLAVIARDAAFSTRRKLAYTKAPKTTQRGQGRKGDTIKPQNALSESHAGQPAPPSPVHAVDPAEDEPDYDECAGDELDAGGVEVDESGEFDDAETFGIEETPTWTPTFTTARIMYEAANKQGFSDKELTWMASALPGLKEQIVGPISPILNGGLKKFTKRATADKNVMNQQTTVLTNALIALSAAHAVGGHKLQSALDALKTAVDKAQEAIKFRVELWQADVRDAELAFPVRLATVVQQYKVPRDFCIGVVNRDDIKQRITAMLMDDGIKKEVTAQVISAQHKIQGEIKPALKQMLGFAYTDALKKCNLEDI